MFQTKPVGKLLQKAIDRLLHLVTRLFLKVLYRYFTQNKAKPFLAVHQNQKRARPAALFKRPH